MPTQSQNSIINYAPQPYFLEGSCSVVDYIDTDTIENPSGLFDPDLSNFTTVVPDSGVSEFGIKVTYPRLGDHLSTIDMSAALIGCSMLTYEDATGSPDYDTVFNEDIICAMGTGIGTEGNQLITFAHSSQNEVRTFCRTPLPGIISGGQTNLNFHGLGTSKTTPTNSISNITFSRSAANVTARPHVRLIIGHFFVGVDIPVTIDPNSFSWHLGLKTQRFFARDEGAKSSEGTLSRRASGEIIKIPNERIVGINVTDVSSEFDIDVYSNFFDLTKVNNSYPLLFNPYPVGAIPVSSLTAELANLTARQNYFSIYGFLEDSLEFSTGAYRDGLDSEYRARFRIQETR